MYASFDQHSIQKVMQLPTQSAPHSYAEMSGSCLELLQCYTFALRALPFSIFAGRKDCETLVRYAIEENHSF